MDVVVAMGGGCTVEELKCRMTVDEKNAWLLRKDQEFEEPSRTDYYLMAIRRQLMATAGVDTSSIGLSDLVLRYDNPVKQEQESTYVESVTAQSKVAWAARIGFVPQESRAQSNE